MFAIRPAETSGPLLVALRSLPQGLAGGQGSSPSEKQEAKLSITQAQGSPRRFSLTLMPTPFLVLHHPLSPLGGV